MFKGELDRFKADITKSLGSEFYAKMLQNVTNNPVYMPDNIENYVKDGYLFNPIVYSVVSMIAQQASQIPWSVYSIKNKKALSLYKSASPDLAPFKKAMIKTKALQELPDHELNGLLEKPNVLQSWTEFIEQVIGFKLVCGNSYIHCIGPTGGVNAGTIREMWTVPAQIVTIVAGDQYNPIKQYEVRGDRNIVIPREQMIHLKYWTPNWSQGTFLYGISPIQAGRRVVTKSNSSYDTSVSMFQNFGAVGIVSPEPGHETEQLTEEQQEMIEERFKRKTGPRNAGRPLISSVPLRWQQTGMSAVDLAIIESDKMDLRTICMIFHYPSELMGDAAAKTYSNTKEAGSAAYTKAIIPSLTQVRDSINTFIKGKYEGKIFLDYDVSMISELQEDLTALTTALSNAWYLSGNEKRDMISFAMDERNPMMNEYFVPAGVMPLSAMTATPDDIALEEAEKQLGL